MEQGRHKTATRRQALQVTKLVVFDCDGTLVDSQANIITAMRESFINHGLTPPADKAIRAVVGLSLLETMQTLLPEADLPLQTRMADDYKVSFQRLRAKGLLEIEPLFSGIRDTLAALRDHGFILGVATGKSVRGLNMCLEHHQLIHHFSTLQTADHHPSKPHPSMLQQAMLECEAVPENTVMIGDTVYDIAMGINANVCALGVSWGYHDDNDLRAAGAHAVANDATELQQLILA